MKSTKRVIASFIMSSTTLNAIVKGYEALESTYAEQRGAFVKQLVFNLPEGETSTAVWKEYTRRLDYVSDKIAAHRKVEPESIKKAIRRDLAAIGWSAPRQERTEGEKAEAARKTEATRKQVDRTAKKLANEARKLHPKMKIDMDVYKLQAKEKIADERDSTKAELKQKADHARTFVEGTKRFTMPELLAAFNDCVFSDDKKWNDDCASRFGAAIAFAKNRVS